MPSGITIIKRGASKDMNGPSAEQIEKTGMERDREMANTVKNWVAEWEARNRSLKSAAFALIRSVERGRSGSAQRFAVIHR